MRQKRIVSIGTNTWKTHSKALKLGYMFPEPHSELRALMKIPEAQRSKLILINFRFNKRGETKMSKPCSKCLPWATELFKKVYYTTDTGIVRLTQ